MPEETAADRTSRRKRAGKNGDGDCLAPVSSAPGGERVLREAKPVWLRCLHRAEIAGEIVWTAGPWRSSGDWSEQEGWSREEWDIAVSSETGLVLYRLVQDKLGGDWFVEGMYD